METASVVPTVIVASDSFKGSLSAHDATQAMAAGARLAFGDGAQIVEIPLADGGEGTLDALLAAWGWIERTVPTVDAIGRPIAARYGVNESGTVALIEAAEANGLPAVSDVPLQPLHADTFGVGLIAKDAIDLGVDEILLCIGGSATTDGGTGLLRGLGARFIDEQGDEVRPGGGGLRNIRAIDVSGLDPRASRIRWRIAVDVTNPLLGPDGAASMFGPQKGATPADVEELESGLRNFAAVTEAYAFEAYGAVADRPGLGAAGGLAFAPAVLLGAELLPGGQLVSDALDLPARLAGADLILTGEGAFDHQSLRGKVVDLVRRTSSPDTPIVVVAGRVQLSADECATAGIAAAFSIAPGPSTLDELGSRAAELVRDTAAHAASIFARASHRSSRARRSERAAN